MKRLAFLALAASAVCAVAFSPGIEVLFAVSIIVLTILAVPNFGHFPPLLNTSPTTGRLTGHGHINSRADGLGVGGRHGPPRGIVVMVLAVWSTVLVTSRLGHAVMKKFAASAGHSPARTNMSAQPLPA